MGLFGGKNNSDRFPSTDIDMDKVVTFKDSNGKDTKFEFLDLITISNREFCVFLPLEDSDGMVVILEAVPDSDDSESYVPVDSDTTDTVFALFKHFNSDKFDFT